MERRGRNDVDAVARETSHETGKPEEDVRRYHATFWKKYREIADWERLVDKVEKGEKRLLRSREIRDALAAKVARHPKPYECLPLNYGASRGKVWTEEEDAFLINMMHAYGYGNWERIRVEIRNAWQFNFDWFFKSRNAQELARRADLLIRLVEKENEEHARDATAKASTLEPGSDAANALADSLGAAAAAAQPAKKKGRPKKRAAVDAAEDAPPLKAPKQDPDAAAE